MANMEMIKFQGEMVAALQVLVMVEMLEMVLLPATRCYIFHIDGHYDGHGEVSDGQHGDDLVPRRYGGNDCGAFWMTVVVIRILMI